MRIPVLMLALFAATACTMETAPIAATDAAPTVPAAVASAPAGQDAGLSGLMNDFRASQGKAALVQSASLTQAATAHVQDMVSQGYFSHDGLNGSTVGSRVRAAGCDWSGVAENIAQGPTTPDQAMGIWINSAGHRANLLGPYTKYGAARSGNTWILVFASGC